uniref:hypothetical protein n=1 Tax=Clostridium sp. 12(A) TaxID=1163671 RepID=UPI00046659D2|nr:hypothetical protein [Clostridium sp. 12(A)]
MSVFHKEGRIITSSYIIDKLTKAKRKFKAVENWRSAELFCIGCDKSLGAHDLIYESHESLKYCGGCIKQLIKETPIKLSDGLTILEDYGLSVVLRYEELRQEETKQCYFTSKGRFIKIKSKRWYI